MTDKSPSKQELNCHREPRPGFRQLPQLYSWPEDVVEQKNAGSSLTPSNWSSAPIMPPLKKRLKTVLRPVAQRALPTLLRLAGDPTPSKNPRTVVDQKFVRGYRALEREFPEADSPGNGEGNEGPTTAAVKLKVKAARKAKSLGSYLDQVSHGDSLEQALVDGARSLIRDGEKAKAIAIGHSLRSRPESFELGAAVLGTALLHRSGPENAWKVLSEVRNTPASETVPNEFYAAAFGTLGADARQILDEDINAGRARRWDSGPLLRVAQKALAHGLNREARELLRLGLERPAGSMSDHVRKEFERLATWLPEGSRRAEMKIGRGTINFGVMGYEQPDITSRNIGDYIQTVASMGHVVRQKNFTFDGDVELVEFANELRAGVKPERVVDGPEATLNLVELSRDGNPLQALPEKTWALAFGWFMHHMFGQGYGLPFHENLRPILVSVFVRFPDMLTPEAIEYLKKYAPVGCRDWQTVALLRAVGVPAFFSGCMTTTIDTVFRRDGEDQRNATIFVDAPQTGPGDSRTQVQTGIRSLSFTENLRLARDWVSQYHLTYNNVVTSRLHCFLPARSVGSSVTFLPKNRSDNRFGGLIDSSEEDFNRIRQGILEKASTMLQAIASGRTDDEVYSLWREICEPAMAEADAYLASAELPILATEQVDRLLDSSSADDPDEESETIHVVVDTRRGEGKRLSSLIRSILAHTEVGVHLWITADAVSASERRQLEEQRFPVNITWVDAQTDVLEQLGASKPSTRHEVVLSLAFRAIRGVRQAVFIPATALVRSDLTGLAALAPTGGSVLTARDDQHRGRGSGLEMFRRVASRQGTENRKALEFIFASHRRVRGDFAAFDSNVMVVNLEAAREARFAEQLVALVTRYGMTFREALNTVVGPRREELDQVWNHTPGYEEQNDPLLVNWRDTVKPGGAAYTPYASELTGNHA